MLDAWGSQTKRSFPGFASLTFHVFFPTKRTVVARLNPGAMTWALWIRERSLTTSR